MFEKYALENRCNLYFLTYIDTPWKPDDLRDRSTHRKEMFEAFKNTLISHKKPFVVLKGNKEERLKKAVKHIDELLKLKNENLLG